MPGGQTFTKHATLRNRNYLAPDWLTYTNAAAHGHRLAMYYPTVDGTATGTAIDGTPAPAGGWPLVMQVSNTGFSNSNDAYADGDDEPISNDNGEELMWYALMNKCAACWVQVPAVTTDVIAMDDHDGSTAITGGTKNLVHLPGNPYRYYEGGILAAIDNNGGKGYLNAFNAVTQAIQHVRYHAALFNINPEKVSIGGISGGACTAAWVGFAPNRAGELGTGGQYEMSTVPNSVFVIDMTLVSYRHWVASGAVSIQMSVHMPTSEGTATVNTAWTACTTGTQQVPSRYQDDISTWATLPGFTEHHLPPFVWQVGETTVPDLQIYEPFRQGVGTVGHDPWAGLVMRNRFRTRGKLWVSGAVSTGINGTNRDLHDGVMGDVGTEALANKSTNAYVAQWMENIHRPRWDTVMPPGGIRRRGQSESVGRVCVPANPARGGVHVACRPGGSAIRIGEGNAAEADIEIQPGEKFYLSCNGHVWIKSVSGIGYWNAREAEDEKS